VPIVDADGRRRYVDAAFEPWGVHIEIDGRQHMEVRSWWADMKRQNALGVHGRRVLRFPAWALRNEPDVVIAQIRAALIAAGWRP
jgi:very-short-patch-repair endonuclease